MVLVDTSLWVDFLRRRASEEVRLFVQQALQDRTAAYTCPTAMELLGGSRTAKEEAAVRELLELGHHVPLEWAHWALSAQVLRSLQKGGHRVPLSDVLTAAVAMRGALPLACRDKHFETIRNHGGQALEVRYIG
jgi:predicted nucleic acid-binding protein